MKWGGAVQTKCADNSTNRGRATIQLEFQPVVRRATAEEASNDIGATHLVSVIKSQTKKFLEDDPLALRAVESIQTLRHCTAPLLVRILASYALAKGVPCI